MCLDQCPHLTYNGCTCTAGAPTRKVLPKKKRRPPNRTAAGSVRIHASKIFWIVLPWIPDLLAHIVPAIPEDRTCVVLTGMWKKSARPIVIAATVSAAAPCAYVRCVLPILPQPSQKPLLERVLYHALLERG